MDINDISHITTSDEIEFGYLPASLAGFLIEDLSEERSISDLSTVRTIEDLSDTKTIGG